MKFLNNSCINGNISKLVELPDNYIINGQIYDKNTMYPITRQTLPIKSTDLNELNLLTTIFTNSITGPSRIDNSTIMDSENYNVYYKITQNVNNSSEAGIYRITNNNNNFDYTYSALCSGYGDHLDIISQDTDNIYLLVYKSNNKSYILVVNKNKLIKTNEIALSDNYIMNILKDTANYIYLYSVNLVLTETIMRFNKNTKEITTIYNSPLTGNVTTQIRIPILDNSNDEIKFYSLQDAIYKKISKNHSFIYTKNAFNISTSAFNQSVVNIELNGFDNEILNISTSISTSPMFSELLLYENTENNKKYITHFIYCNIAGSTIDDKNNKMITYEIIDEDNWKVVDYVNFAPFIHRAILPINDNNTLLALRNEGCDIYSWSFVNNKYEVINSIESAMISAGLDSNNNIFIEKGDTSVELINKAVPIYLFADFEKDVYDFNYDDIETNIIVYAKNFENKYISTPVQLQLLGNVKFKDDGLKIKTTSTTNSEMKIPVVITGAGRFQVLIKYI